MKGLTIEEKVKIITEMCNKHNITAYEIGKETGLSAAGLQKILNNEVKKPRNKTLNTILEYIEKKLTGNIEHNKEENITFVENAINNQYIPKKSQTGIVPYYNVELASTCISNFSEAKDHIEFYIDYKPLNNCTAYFPYYGHSMQPMYYSGNTLAVKEITNFEIILWGEPHLIITNDNANNYKTVKCIHQHEDPTKIILRATNPNYSGDVVINIKDILSLYIVKGKIEITKL